MVMLQKGQKEGKLGGMLLSGAFRKDLKWDQDNMIIIKISWTSHL
jgi:hypothetical protein